MTHNELSKKIKDCVKSLSSLPLPAKVKMDVCGGASANPSDLTYLISLDPVLTGRLIQLFNSAFGPLSRIPSPVQFVTMLGVNTVKNLVINAAPAPVLPKGVNPEGLNLDNFRLHSLCTGIISRFLAKEQGIDISLHEEYFTAGLLHDIGKMVLDSASPADYALALQASLREKKPLYLAEESLLGINHCGAGEIMAALWKPGKPVADVIARHHQTDFYSGENANILCTVAIANYFSSVNEAGFSVKPDGEKPGRKIWDTAGIKEDSFEKIKDFVLPEIEKSRKFLRF